MNSVISTFTGWSRPTSKRGHSSTKGSTRSPRSTGSRQVRRGLGARVFGSQRGGWHGGRITSAMAAHNEPIAQPAQAFRQRQRLRRPRLRFARRPCSRFVGGCGDAALKRALGRYTRRYRFEHPTLEQFTDVMREVLGEGAHQALRSALFERGWVDYLVTNAVSKPDEAPQESSIATGSARLSPGPRETRPRFEATRWS